MSALDNLSRYTPYALAALRISSGLIFLLHGTQKLFAFPGPPAGGSLPPMFSLLWIGAVIELVGGTAIMAGFYTRLAAFICSGQMAVAYWMFHAPRNLYPTLNGGDAAILYCFVFLLLVFTGPGAWAANRK